VHIPACDDEVGIRRGKRSEHARNERGRVAEVRVHHTDDAGRRHLKTSHDRGTQPQLPGTMNDAHPMDPGKVVRDVPGAIRRVVVDDDELELDTVSRARGENFLHQFGEPVALVVGREDHGEVGRRRITGRRGNHGCTIIQPAQHTS
jgi:hypothetical protein